MCESQLCGVVERQDATEGPHREAHAQPPGAGEGGVTGRQEGGVVEVVDEAVAGGVVDVGIRTTGLYKCRKTVRGNWVRQQIPELTVRP